MNLSVLCEFSTCHAEINLKTVILTLKRNKNHFTRASRKQEHDRVNYYMLETPIINDHHSGKPTVSEATYCSLRPLAAKFHCLLV